jgi:hypothetical protein
MGDNFGLPPQSARTPDALLSTPMTWPLHFWKYGRRFIVNSDPDEPKKATEFDAYEPERH